MGTSRRRFIFAAGAVPVAFPWFKALAQSNSGYTCSPCGCQGDKMTFDAPGKCPYCGMPLVLKTDLEARRHGRLPDNAASVTFPFELIANQIFLPVWIGGKGPYNFILDTGATYSNVASEFAAEIGAVSSMDLPVDFMLPRSLTVRTTPGVIPLALSQALIARPVHGILGYDVMQRYVWRIDYAAKSLTIYDPDRYSYAGPGTAFPFSGMWSSYDPQIDAELQVEGQAPIPVRLTIDIGAGGTIISTPLVEANKLVEAARKTYPLYGVAGVTPDVKLAARISALRIGGYMLERPLVLLSQDPKGVFAGKSISVNTGGSILSRFTVIVDYARNRIILEPNSDFAKPFAADASGIALEATGSDFRRFVVRSVVADSPAGRAGLQAGDVIAAVDGQPAGNYVAWQLQDVFKNSGRNYALTIERGSRSLIRTIKLEELL